MRASVCNPRQCLSSTSTTKIEALARLQKRLVELVLHGDCILLYQLPELPFRVQEFLNLLVPLPLHRRGVCPYELHFRLVLTHFLHDWENEAQRALYLHHVSQGTFHIPYQR